MLLPDRATSLTYTKPLARGHPYPVREPSTHHMVGVRGPMVSLDFRYCRLASSYIDITRSSRHRGQRTVPRSTQDILDHGDELARKLEDYRPSAEDEVTGAEQLLRRAALARAYSERRIAEAVDQARRDGLTWRRIGAELGVSAQAAQQRYGSLLAAGRR